MSKKFKIINKKYYIDKKTLWGLVGIQNVIVDYENFQKCIVEIFLDKKNLEYLFLHKIETVDDEIKMLSRFTPSTPVNDLEKFVEEQMKNVNFYSFLAEALVALITRDTFRYQLSKAILDWNDTLIDTHSGVDACMYDKKNELVVLGESKFYINMSKGINKIISDFTKRGGFYNKLDNLCRTSLCNDESKFLIIKHLKKKELERIYIQDFIKMKIMFLGFVLHNHIGNKDKYCNDDFYDDFDLNVKKISENVRNIFSVELPKNSIKIIMIHLPIKSKKELIMMMINHFNSRMEELLNEQQNYE